MGNFFAKKQKNFFSEGKIVSSIYVFLLQSAKEFLKQGSVTAEVFFRANEGATQDFYALKF